MNEEVKPVNYLDLAYPKLVPMLEQLERELVAVEAGEDRTRNVLKELSDIEDSFAMLAGVIRKVAHLRLYPEVRIVDPADSIPDDEPTPVSSGVFEAILLAALHTFNEGGGVTKTDELAGFSLIHDLLPFLEMRKVEVSHERLQGGFTEVIVKEKSFLQGDDAPRERRMGLWGKIVRHLATIPVVCSDL